jgi:hypothetical protein
MAWQRVKIDIPKDFGPDERERLAFDILEHIRKRTSNGQGLNSNGTRLRQFPKYSESYSESLDFKIAGKSTSDVNLKLSGDMLDAMDLLNHRSGQITIGFENGSDENARAEGNILGSYGGAPNKAKARNFLGVTAKELEIIVKQYRRDYG